VKHPGREAGVAQPGDGPIRGVFPVKRPGGDGGVAQAGDCPIRGVFPVKRKGFQPDP